MKLRQTALIRPTLTRAALTGSLLLFLAACGNGGPVDPPTTTGTTTDGTTGSASGTTGIPTTTGGTTTSTTTGFPSTTGGTVTGGSTTGGSTTGSSTTGGSTTGGSTTGGTGTISGTITAPSGGNVTGTVILSCTVADVQDNSQCDDVVRAQADSSGAYTFTDLQATPYVVYAAKDVDSSGTLTDGDYVGYYSEDGTDSTMIGVTPPQTGINFTMQIDNGGTDSVPGELTGTWTGTTTTPEDTGFGTEQTTFEFLESDGDLSGTLTLVSDVGAPPNNPIEGTVADAEVSVSSFYSVDLDDGTAGTLEYLYEGTLSGTTLAGDVTLLLDDEPYATGSFSVTQGGAVAAPLGNFGATLLSRMSETKP